MKKEIFFGRKSIRFWYLRYKDSAYYTVFVIIVTIVVCLLLLFSFILPQLEQWFSIRNEVLATRARVDIINENIRYLNTLDRNALNTQTSIASQALPAEKNFGAILDALNLAALRSGVTFQDYSFKVGNISSNSVQMNSIKLPGISPVTVSLVINGTIDEVKMFTRELSNTLPLSEVTSIDGESGAITVTMDFYQKNLPKTTLKDDQPIPQVVGSNPTLTNQLSSWQIRPQTSNSSPIGSSSALPLF
jgi:Tfp pilus assembly protein PilO